jgi:hypothetical protein
MPVMLIWAAAMLLAIGTIIIDGIVLRQRASVAVRADVAPPEVRPLTRATDLLPIIAFQVVVAGLAQFIPLTTSARVNTVIALVFAASLLVLVAISLGFALVNMRPHVALATPRPTIPKLVAEPGIAYHHRVHPASGDAPAWLAYLALSLALAADLIPWLFSELPDIFGIKTALGITGLPGGIANIIDMTLLVCGLLGLSMLLAGVVLMGRSAILAADHQGMSLHQGIVRRAISWRTARQFLVRDHGDGRYSYQLVGSEPRDVITWWEHPERHQGEITAAEMAAAVTAYSKLEPQWLDPQATAALIQQRIAGWSGQVARDTERLG